MPARARTAERVLGVLQLVGLALVVVRLARLALDGTLASDECFHAYAAEWIAQHHAIPETFPELYSGFFYYYPPLLHLIGAAWIGLFGVAHLLALPVAMHAALLLLLVTGAFGAIPRRAGLWAAVLLAVHPGINAMAVRFYVEPLVTLLVVAGVALLLRARAGGGWGTAILLGLVTGLALLAKFNAWALWLAIAGVAAFELFRGDRRRAVQLAAAAGIAALMVLPWLVRNHRLFGSAWYPAFAPLPDRVLYALNAHRFSTPPGDFLAALPGLIGPWIGALALAGLGAAALHRRWTFRESLLAGALLAMIVTAFVPFSQARHLNPPLAVLAMVAAWAASDAFGHSVRPRLATGAMLVALLACGLFASPNPRAAADPPEFLREALPEVAKHSLADAKILSLWTYDTFYATRRASTWPIPWGQASPQAAMFFDRDPDSLLVHLREAGITHVLSPTRLAAGNFNSANYPESFLRGIAELLRAGRLRFEWRSSDLVLLSVAPSAAVVDSTRR